MPRQRRGAEQEPPILDGDVEREGFLARRACDDEGVLVDALEEVEVGVEGAAEGGDCVLLFGEGFGAIGGGEVRLGGEGGGGEVGDDVGWWDGKGGKRG